MNSIEAEIQEIKTDQQLCLIQAKYHGLVLSAVLLLSDELKKLQKGQNIQLLFKETETMLCTENTSNLSVQNKIPCKVVSIHVGEILSRVILLFHEQHLSAVITSNAVKQLGVKEGDNIFALVKSNELTLLWK